VCVCVDGCVCMCVWCVCLHEVCACVYESMCDNLNQNALINDCKCKLHSPSCHVFCLGRPVNFLPTVTGLSPGYRSMLTNNHTHSSTRTHKHTHAHAPHPPTHPHTYTHPSTHTHTRTHTHTHTLTDLGPICSPLNLNLSHDQTAGK